MSSNTELQNYLAKLLLIKNGLILADNELDKFAREHRNLQAQLTGFSRPDPQKEARLSEISEQARIVIEALIIELFNLSEVRSKYLNNVVHTPVQKILTSLKPCSDILDNNDRLIRELRNNIIAHGEIQGTDFRGTTDIFRTQSDPYKKVFLSVKCACMFVEGVITNLTMDVVIAKEIVKNHMGGTTVDASDYFASIVDARQIRSQTSTKLQAEHLNGEISFVGATE